MSFRAPTPTATGAYIQGPLASGSTFETGGAGISADTLLLLAIVSAEPVASVYTGPDVQWESAGAISPPGAGLAGFQKMYLSWWRSTPCVGGDEVTVTTVNGVDFVVASFVLNNASFGDYNVPAGFGSSLTTYAGPGTLAMAAVVSYTALSNPPGGAWVNTPGSGPLTIAPGLEVYVASAYTNLTDFTPQTASWTTAGPSAIGMLVVGGSWSPSASP